MLTQDAGRQINHEGRLGYETDTILQGGTVRSPTAGSGCRMELPVPAGGSL
jgi:hypothetical protein